MLQRIMRPSIARASYCEFKHDFARIFFTLLNYACINLSTKILLQIVSHRTYLKELALFIKSYEKC